MHDLDDFDFQILHLQRDCADVPDDALSRNVVRQIDFQTAIKAADLSKTHNRLQEISDDGVIDWSRFDITNFPQLMPSLAVLDRTSDSDGEVDFTYGYVGETINTIARRSLRGLNLRNVLHGEAREQIMREYCDVLDRRRPSASSGHVVVSDMDWMRYLRLLYPVQHSGKVSRILLIMLFAVSDSEAAGQPWLPVQTRP